MTLTGMKSPILYQATLSSIVDTCNSVRCGNIEGEKCINATLPFLQFKNTLRPVEEGNKCDNCTDANQQEKLECILPFAPLQLSPKSEIVNSAK